MVEKKLSKDPSRFGKGAIEGVAGPESANNACAQTTCVADASLKTGSECSFTTRKLRFLACFCLVLPASPTFFNGLLAVRLAQHSSGFFAQLP
jgi:hypothetical protein